MRALFTAAESTNLCAADLLEAASVPLLGNVSSTPSSTVRCAFLCPRSPMPVSWAKWHILALLCASLIEFFPHAKGCQNGK